jgi:hypothetical protein
MQANLNTVLLHILKRNNQRKPVNLTFSGCLDSVKHD